MCCFALPGAAMGSLLFRSSHQTACVSNCAPTKAAADAFTGKERLLVEFTRTLMREHTLPDELFHRMEQEFGRAKFIEAVGLLGHYITIGTVIRLFEVEPPPGTKTF